MRKKILLLIATASCLFVSEAFSADWKLYGRFSSPPDIETVMFYDPESIKNVRNSITVWTKTVPLSEIVKSLENKLVVEKAGKRIASGYTAPITKLYPEAVDAPYLEEAANGPVQSKAEFLYELICSQNKFRRLSGAAYNPDGSRDSRFGIAEWEIIEPESNAGSLARILCGK